jgi:HD superfamily phosphodiesterase
VADAIEEALRVRVGRDEKLAGPRGSDSLWDHLQRVARYAERLGAAEGLDAQLCRLAGLFHDAGKFAYGGNQVDDRAEEERSVEVLREVGAGLPTEQVGPVAEAILMLYRGEPEPTPLARVLFDADNLDKLGPLGIANYFNKVGLRGGGISERVLRHLTVELTYARVAPDTMMTDAGRELARARAAQTMAFTRDLLDALREDGLLDLRVVEVPIAGLILQVVEPERCACGGVLDRKLWEEPGMKCAEIHLQHRCSRCSDTQHLRFCRPRLSTEAR